MAIRVPGLSLLSISIAIVTGPMATADDFQTVPAYRATYEASYKGKRVGTSEFSITRDTTAGTYRFDTSSRFQGILNLVSPKPVIETSEFTYHDGRIQPHSYSYEDGSRKGEDNYQVVFDWDNGSATTTADAQTIQSEIVPGMLDRGSMLVAMMLDMHGSLPDSYTLVDDDGIRIYDYSSEGEETLETPLGSLATEKLIQQRQGSSRRTIIWAAGELNFLPVRIEQQRDGETRAAFDLQTVEWLDETA